jgi:hypothetical protein
MMNLKTLVTAALVLGTSSLALADHDSRDSRDGRNEVSTPVASPVLVRDHRMEEQPTPVYQAPVYQTPAYQQPVYQQPVRQDRDDWNRAPALRSLATTKLVNGKDVIRFGGSLPLRSIKLEATRGRTQISQVKIRFANGESQIVYPNKQLSGRSSIDIDLDGNVRNVTGITIWGNANMRSSFEILGG